MIDFKSTELHTWFERDRAHVELRNTDTDETIVEWWDEDVAQAVEDGFLPARAFIMGKLRRPDLLHKAAFEYAAERGLLGKGDKLNVT